jgi:hypothetical protein
LASLVARRGGFELELESQKKFENVPTLSEVDGTARSRENVVYIIRNAFNG